MLRSLAAGILIAAVACGGGGGGGGGTDPDAGPPGVDARTTGSLRIVLEGSGAGTVNIAPPDENCTGDCTTEHPLGSTVTLTATPGIRSVFAGWRGGCAGSTNTTTVAIDGDVQCTADFLTTYELSVTFSGLGEATIRSVPAGIDCPGTCSARFTDGETVTLTATSASGVAVAAWHGDCSGSASSAVVTTDATKSCELELSWSSAHWARTYGTVRDNRTYAAATTADGGYVAAGYSSDENQGLHDGMVIKVDSAGAPQWQTRYGTVNKDELEAITELAGGGFIAAGRSYVTGASLRVWLLRLDPAGDIVWQTTFGDTGDATIHGMTAVTGGFVLVGEHDTVGPTIERRGLVLKISDAGTVLWSHLLGTGGNSVLEGVTTLSSGNAVAVGTNQSGPWVVEIDPSGAIVRERTLVSATTARFSAVAAAGTGWIAGGQLYRPASPYADAWLVAFDETAAISWQKTYSKAESVYGIAPGPSGGFVVAGQTQPSLVAEVFSGWILGIDSTGAPQWERQYGSPYVGAASVLRGVATASDGRVFAAGHESGWGAGSSDAWLIAVDGSGGIGAATCPAWVGIALSSTVADSAATTSITTATVTDLASPVEAPATTTAYPLGGTIDSVCYD